MATDWIERLKGLSSISTDSLSQSVTKLILLPIAAFFFGIANSIEAISNLFIQPLQAFADGLVSVVEGILGGAGGIIQEGAQTTQQGLAPFGILAWLIAIAIALAGAYLLAQYAAQEDTSDLIPFSLTDVPFLGAEEDEG